MDKSVYNDIAKELNLDPEVVKEAYLTQWKFIKMKIEELPLKGELSEKEFEQLKTNFNLPSLGKFYTTIEKVERAKRRVEYLKKLLC